MPTAFMSNYLANKLLDHSLGTAAYTMPTPYVALYTVAPTEAGGGTEATGAGYARVQASFGAAANEDASNDVAITFPTPTGGDWGTVVAWSVMDAPTGGNQLYAEALTQAKVTADGDPVQFPIGALTISRTDAA